MNRVRFTACLWGNWNPYPGMPVDGWMDPQVSERFLRRVDEGVFERPNGVPVRRVRYDFMDDTLWLHPGSDLRVRSSTPRQNFISLNWSCTDFLAP